MDEAPSSSEDVNVGGPVPQDDNEVFFSDDDQAEYEEGGEEVAGDEDSEEVDGDEDSEEVDGDEDSEEEFDEDFEGYDSDELTDEDFDDEDIEDEALSPGGSDASERLGAEINEATSRGPVNYMASSTCMYNKVPSKWHHFQTADALVFIPRPCGSGEPCGCEEVLVGGPTSLSVVRLFDDPSKDSELLSEAPHFFRFYSLAASPCGNVVAVCGEFGCVTVYWLSRPPPASPSASPSPSADSPCWQLVHIATMSCGTANQRGSLMSNSVRFGYFNGEMRIIIAGQVGEETGAIFLLNLPTGPAQATAAQALMVPVAGLRRWEAPWMCRRRSGGLPTMVVTGEVVGPIPDQPMEFTAERVCLLAVSKGDRRLTRESFEGSKLLQTASLSQFRHPLNCSVGSPDGRWLALAFDVPCLALIPAHTSYYKESCQLLSLEEGPMTPRRIDERLQPGCQYVAFNASSTLLAASSDCFRCVFVWSVPQGSLLFELRPRQQPRPCLPLSWWGTHPSILVFAETTKNVFVVDCNAPLQGTQRISLPRSPDGELRVNGLAVGGGGRLLLATSGPLLAVPLLTRWSRAEHKCFPPAFKRVAKVMLLASEVRGSAAAPTASSAGLDLGASSSSAAPCEPSTAADWAEEGPSSGLTPQRSSALRSAATTGEGSGAGGSESAECPLQHLPYGLLDMILSAAAMPLYVWASQDKGVVVSLAQDAAAGVVQPTPQPAAFQEPVQDPNWALLHMAGTQRLSK